MNELTLDNLLDNIGEVNDGIVLTVNPRLQKEGSVLLNYIMEEKIDKEFGGDSRKYFGAIKEGKVAGNSLNVNGKEDSWRVCWEENGLTMTS